MIQLKGTKLSTLPIVHYLNGRKLHKGEDLELIIGEILSAQGFDGAFQVNRKEGTVSTFRWSTKPDPRDYLDENTLDWPDDWEATSEPSYFPLYRTPEICGARSF